jgi:hypothetical protein
VPRQAQEKATDEIERLLAFLDASDSYASTELEDDNYSGNASYPESGWRAGKGEPDNGRQRPSPGGG